MFMHEFRYFLLKQVRNRIDLFWSLVFPLILGTLFYIAFSNIANSTEIFHSIPVSVIETDLSEHSSFSEAIDSLSSEENSESEPLLDVTYDTSDDAGKKLLSGEVEGILSVDENDQIQLTISPDSDTLNASILQTFVQEYNVKSATVADIMSTQPDKMPVILETLSNTENVSFLNEVSLTDGNLDIFTQYFYNLIAMACLFASFAGINIAIKNQANLSEIGARTRVSPTNHLVRILSEFSACVLIQTLCIFVNLCYILFVLKIDFGSSTPLIFLTALIGTTLGVCFGFFVGCLGHISEGSKIGILISVSMAFSFLSGLMVDSMRMLIEKNIPLFNKINPAALIADSFYTLNIYGPGVRYLTNIFTLFIYSALLLAASFFIVRRERYASL